MDLTIEFILGDFTADERPMTAFRTLTTEGDRDNAHLRNQIKSMLRFYDAPGKLVPISAGEADLIQRTIDPNFVTVPHVVADVHPIHAGDGQQIPNAGEGRTYAGTVVGATIYCVPLEA